MPLLITVVNVVVMAPEESGGVPRRPGLGVCRERRGLGKVLCLVYLPPHPQYQKRTCPCRWEGKGLGYWRAYAEEEEKEEEGWAEGDEATAVGGSTLSSALRRRRGCSSHFSLRCLVFVVASSTGVRALGAWKLGVTPLCGVVCEVG